MASNRPACSICDQCYDHQSHCPRMLPCAHTFCSGCLEKLIDCNAIKCPKCRETCPVPMLAGVRGLRKNFELLDIMDTINATPQHADKRVSLICEEIRALASKAMSHVEEIEAAKLRVVNASTCMLIASENVAALIQDSVFKLQMHAVLTFREKSLMNELDEFYKNTVNESADIAGLPSNFSFLNIKDASHHKCLLQAKAVSKCRYEEREALALNASTDDEEIKAAEARMKGVILDLKKACDEMAREIKTVFTQLHDGLAAREQVLIHSLNELCNSKRSNFEIQYLRLSLTQVCLMSTIQEPVISTLESLRYPVLLDLKSNIKSTLENIESQHIVLEPEVACEPEVIFDEDVLLWSLYNLDGRELLHVIESMGTVIDKSTCTAKTNAAGFGLQCAPLGGEASFTITAHDAQGYRRGEGSDVFVVELQKATGEGKVGVNLENKGDGTYLATYTVPADAEPGDYTLSVLLRGAHIQDSPFVVRVGY